MPEPALLHMMKFDLTVQGDPCRCPVANQGIHCSSDFYGGENLGSDSHNLPIGELVDMIARMVHRDQAQKRIPL